MLRRTFFRFVLTAASALVLAAPLGLIAKDPAIDPTKIMSDTTSKGGHYIKPGCVNFKQVLPPPPEPGSLAAMADLETVQRVHAARTPNDVAWAKLIERDDIFNNAMVLGSWFDPENLPVTAAFLKDVTDDLHAAGFGGKKLYPRPRPPLVDPALHPVVDIPTTGSYPSGHTLQAFVWAYVLAEIFPEQRAELLERAHQAAWGRVIGGAHFPSDLIGGQILAKAIFAEFMKSAAFRADVQKCRAEVEPYLRKKAA